MAEITCIRHNIPTELQHPYLWKVPLYVILPNELKMLRTLLMYLFLVNST